ncbi:MAG: GntR family transcriptional regulator, partial [Planctomycetota bacterium]|nr:GntR family transcriptional regulator [Planctomycetota bacterium]
MEHFDLSQSTAPRPASLKHRAYDHIRQKLFDGRLGEGAHLSPVDLGKEIGISHIPVREAITQLASEGLVVHIARQGAFVRQMQRQELLELFELRGMLETATIIKVAKRIRPAELGDLAGYLKGLADVVELFRAVDDGSVDEGSGSDNSDREYAEKMVSLMGEWTLADLAFHMLLLRIGGNRQVTGVIAERQIMLQMFRHRTDSPEAWNRPLAKYYEENFLLHQDIYEAVRQA